LLAFARRIPAYKASAHMKYGQTIRNLAARGLNWHFHDENVRYLRQTQVYGGPYVQNAPPPPKNKCTPEFTKYLNMQIKAPQYTILLYS
jgi:hypothetical protein